MIGQLAVVPALDDGPVHRLIFALDVERSTTRTNPAKGRLRRVLYELLEQALAAAGIGPRHREELADRGDGVLVLIRPHDDVPKTVLFQQVIPLLTARLAAYNQSAAEPQLRMRLRAVIHAGEVHSDGRGFYGDDIDVAFRLLEARAVKRALQETPAAPLVLVVSEELWAGIVRHGYSAGLYQQQIRVKVGNRVRRGRIDLPVPAEIEPSVSVVQSRSARPAPALSLALPDSPAERASASAAAGQVINGHPGRPLTADRG